MSNLATAPGWPLHFTFSPHPSARKYFPQIITKAYSVVRKCSILLQAHIPYFITHYKIDCSLALALDLKGALNAILPGELIQQLFDLRLPGRIVNLVSYFISKKSLCFSSSLDFITKTDGVRDHQKSILSTLLFNLHFRHLRGR